MQVNINGKTEEIPEDSTLHSLLSIFKLKEDRVIFELNGDIVDKSAMKNTPLTEGDEVEIVHFVGGG